MSLVGGKGNSLRRTKLSSKRSNNTTVNQQEVQLAFLRYLFFSGTISVSMSGREDLSWVSLFVSSRIRARRKSKTEKKNTIFFGDYIVKLRLHTGSHSVQSGQLWDFIRKNGDPIAFFSPETVPRWSALAATFRDNVEPGWIGLLPLRLLKNAVSHARRGRGTPTKK